MSDVLPSLQHPHFHNFIFPSSMDVTFIGKGPHATFLGGVVSMSVLCRNWLALKAHFWSSSETWVVQKGSPLSWICGQQDLPMRTYQTQKSTSFGPDTPGLGFKGCWCRDRQELQACSVMQEKLKVLGCSTRRKPPKVLLKVSFFQGLMHNSC